MRLTLLGSGSSGNVAFVEADCGGVTTRLLIDAGLSKSEIGSRLARVASSPPLTLEQIDAVLVTHDHSDHVGCATALRRPLYATTGTIRARQLDAKTVRDGERFQVGAFEVMPVLLPHDAVETVGYVVAAQGARIGILTDCGYDDPLVARAYAGCDVLVLETNHDITMLKFGPYPSSLKRRVMGRRGHLSNDQSAALLRAICQLGPPPQLVIAAHLSQINNRPQLAKSALDRVLGRQGRVLVSSPHRLSPTVLVGEEGVGAPRKVRVVSNASDQLVFRFEVAGEQLS